jgi:predicted O-methyltransferase YrrM
MEKFGIVVVYSENDLDFMDELMYSLDGVEYPVEYVENTKTCNRYELGGIARGMEKFEEFFLLPSTCTIKDISLFDIVFKGYEGKSVSIGKNYLSYIGKYRTEVLKKIGVPIVRTKGGAVSAEQWWLQRYVSEESPIILCPSFKDGEIFQEVYGRKNMILECEYMIKFKGCWDPNMIKEDELNYHSIWESAKRFNILQKKEEFLDFIQWLYKNLKNKRNFLEIGTNSGGTSSVFLKMFENGVSIDLERCQNTKELKEINPNFIQFIGDSGARDIFNSVSYKLYDMIFIDADHTMEGVRRDYLQYKDLLAEDGIIVFHDIRPNNKFIVNQIVDIKVFWDKIKTVYNWEEFMTDEFPDSIDELNNIDPDWGGIGVLNGRKI